MAFTWTDDMGPLGPSPALEAAARAAVIAGVTFLDAIPAGGELPIFNAGQFAIPKNDPAKAFAAAVLEHVPSHVVGIVRETILATAVHVAYKVRRHGGGESGWDALRAQLQARNRRR